ncbi:hypothetical protein B0H11DRAFT_2298480 [Mycena galericulata]|nr:hypothetical protein B0H11DRAFT_2298480 [Mycena galericulata]
MTETSTAPSAPSGADAFARTDEEHDGGGAPGFARAEVKRRVDPRMAALGVMLSVSSSPTPATSGLDHSIVAADDLAPRRRNGQGGFDYLPSNSGFASFDFEASLQSSEFLRPMFPPSSIGGSIMSPTPASASLASAASATGEEAVPLRGLMTRHVIIAASSYAFLSLVDIAPRAIQPLFMATPIELGGLGLPTARIVNLLSIFGCVFFARVRDYIGSKVMFTLGIANALPTFATFPLLSYLARTQGRSILVWAVAILQIILSIGVTFSYGAVFIYTSAAAPNRASLGATNGLCARSDRQRRHPAGMYIREDDWGYEPEVYSRKDHPRDATSLISLREILPHRLDQRVRAVGREFALWAPEVRDDERLQRFRCPAVRVGKAGCAD